MTEYYNEYGKSGHLYFFLHLFEARNDALEAQFSGLDFVHVIKDTESMEGHAAQIFLNK